jgi:hypothetical protein
MIVPVFSTLSFHPHRPNNPQTWRWRMAGRLGWQHRSAPPLSQFSIARVPGAQSQSSFYDPGSRSQLPSKGRSPGAATLSDRLARALGEGKMVSCPTSAAKYRGESAVVQNRPPSSKYAIRSPSISPHSIVAGAWKRSEQLRGNELHLTAQRLVSCVFLD